jgi:hypothetical protein
LHEWAFCVGHSWWPSSHRNKDFQDACRVNASSGQRMAVSIVDRIPWLDFINNFLHRCPGGQLEIVRLWKLL